MARLIRIANWKLALVALVFFCLFTGLGVWQLMRAEQKTVLMKSFSARTEQKPLNVAQMKRFLFHPGSSFATPKTPDETKSVSSGLQFYRITLQGTFDAQHSFLLDNKTYHGQIGYEVYTPFKADGFPATFLIDRGFIPLQGSRAVLPMLQTPTQRVTITGMLNLPPTYVALGEMRESLEKKWPMRIEFIHLDKIAVLLSTSLFPYTITLTQNDPAAYAIEWKAVQMTPERHRGYALQWFALALTLLILFLALNRGDKRL